MEKYHAPISSLIQDLRSASSMYLFKCDSISRELFRRAYCEKFTSDLVYVFLLLKSCYDYLVIGSLAPQEYIIEKSLSQIVLSQNAILTNASRLYVECHLKLCLMVIERHIPYAKWNLCHSREGTVVYFY